MISTTRDVNHITQFITLYNIGILLFASNHDHISQSVCALVFITSACLPYTASTICFAHIIISIDIALRPIIVPAFFCAAPSVFVINENDFPASNKNNAQRARYTIILING
jgi:hypothetical protein